MKYSSGNASTLFCEQVSTVTSLFEKWNDCERTVVMYALLKRLRYPSLKFLQYSIESNLTQNFGSQGNLTAVDISANNPVFLQKLIGAYKSFPIVEVSQLTDKDSILYGSDLMPQNDGKNYNKKEDILNDVLGMLPLLKPGNEEAKSIYLSLIPVAVEDTVRQIVPTELVQQIFSYLLIHPAISNEDRRSLSHWLRNLEDHIQSTFTSTGQQSFYVLSNSTDSQSKSTSVSSVSSGVSRNTWQAIAPPSQSAYKPQQPQICTQQPVGAMKGSSEWNVSIPQVSNSLCDDLLSVNLNEISTSQNSLGLIYDSSSNAVAAPSQSGNSNDDHHVSFSKNGTEIVDFDSSSCDNCNNNAQVNFASFLNVCDHLNTPRWSLDSKMTAIKTRRSNSLTTAISSSSSSASSVITVNDNCSNSSENLAQYAQKPRSYSLSIEHPRGSLTSSGSDTRLDDLKPSYLKFTTHNIGMSSIGQWLKSLRLHKYVGLFTNMTYENMLKISEDYLQSLGVTRGASHKLALCIEKLKERYTILLKMEKDLLAGQVTINSSIEELANIVLTPMKPADSTPNNVAAKFLQVLDLACNSMVKKEMTSAQDEECITHALWILDRSIHNEAFVAHTNQLKEHKFNLSKVKMSFVPKTHHASKSASSGSLNKPRWNSKSRKSENSAKGGSSDRINRKNSNDMLTFSLSSLPQSQQHTSITTNNPCSQTSNRESDQIHHMQCTMSSTQYPNYQQQQHQSQSHFTNGGGIGNVNGNSSVCAQYKSSSYPNFTNSGAIGQNQQPHNQQQLQPQQQHQSHPQYRQHRHSLNNLIVVPACPQQAQQMTFKPGKGMLTTPQNISPTSIGSVATTTECKNRRSSLTKPNVPLTLPNLSQSEQMVNPSTITTTSLGKTMAAVVLENLAKLDQHFKK